MCFQSWSLQLHHGRNMKKSHLIHEYMNEMLSSHKGKSGIYWAIYDWTFLLLEECKGIGGSKLFIFCCVFQKPGFYFKMPVTTWLLKCSNLVGSFGRGVLESYIYMWIYLSKCVNSTVPNALITVSQYCWSKPTKSAHFSYSALPTT